MWGSAGDHLDTTYVNGIVNYLMENRTKLYADDTAIYSFGPSYIDLILEIRYVTGYMKIK